MKPKILSLNMPFPSVSSALTHPNGLLAVGGSLSIPRLVEAYQHGIFPWFMENQPIMWWSPDPRAVIFLKQLHIPSSLKKFLRHHEYRVTLDQAFEEVIKACANRSETWITSGMQSAYCELHAAGFAHSIEVWDQEKLIGGIYGVDCGRIFTGESMFSSVSNASKVALIFLAKYLEQQDYLLIDCQINNPFLAQFGVQNISREEFIVLLNNGLRCSPTMWTPCPLTSLKIL